MLKIGDFSRLASVSIRMLRHYDEIGLLVPELTDKHSHYRYYAPNQLALINKISRLKELGFSLVDIKKILSGSDIEQMRDYFDLRKTELEEDIQQLYKQSKLLEQASLILDRKENLGQYHVVLKSIPRRNVMSLRRRIKSFDDENGLWNELYEEFVKQGVKAGKDALGMTFYHDNEYTSENIDVEIQSGVDKLYTNTNNIKFFEAPSLQVASVIFHGSYDQMPEVSQTIAEWMELHEYEMNGPMLMIFHVSPGQSDNSKEWITEACYQVKKKEEK